MYPVYRENFRIIPDFSSDEYKIDTDFEAVKGAFYGILFIVAVILRIQIRSIQEAKGKI